MLLLWLLCCGVEMQVVYVLLFKPPAVSAIKMCNILTGISPRQVNQLKYIKAFSTARLLYISLCQDCLVNISFAVNQQLFSSRDIYSRWELWHATSVIWICVCLLLASSRECCGCCRCLIVSHGTFHVCEMERKKKREEWRVQFRFKLLSRCQSSVPLVLLMFIFSLGCVFVFMTLRIS